jgi:hypothetical protein
VFSACSDLLSSDLHVFDAVKCHMTIFSGEENTSPYGAKNYHFGQYKSIIIKPQSKYSALELLLNSNVHFV